MNTTKLERLERRVDAIQGESIVTVVFTDGTRRRVPLPDVPCLLIGDPCPVADVIGQAGKGDGMLLELIKGLLEE